MIINKQKSTDTSVVGGKKQIKFITLEEKLVMIRGYECNYCMVKTANATRIPKSTIRNIKKQANKIKKNCISAIKVIAIEVI
jgi:hypothetical protein